MPAESIGPIVTTVGFTGIIGFLIVCKEGNENTSCSNWHILGRIDVSGI